MLVLHPMALQLLATAILELIADMRHRHR